MNTQRVGDQMCNAFALVRTMSIQICKRVIERGVAATNPVTHQGDPQIPVIGK